MFANFSHFSNIMTEWVSGDTGVEFLILKEDEGYCHHLETLYESGLSEYKVLNELKHYVNKNY